MTLYETALSFENKSRDELNLHQSLDWCAETVSAVIDRSSIEEAAKSVTSISCNRMQKAMADSPYWIEPEDDMQVGDPIFFNWGHDYDPEGNLDHVGIIVEVHDNYIVTIEGNTEGRENWRTVKKKTRYRSSLNFNCEYPDVYMRYVGKTNSEPAAPAKTEKIVYNVTVKETSKDVADKVKALAPNAAIEEVKIAVKSNSDLAKEVIDGKWGNGEDRKNKLVAAGYDYDAVQKEVNKLL